MNPKPPKHSANWGNHRGKDLRRGGGASLSRFGIEPTAGMNERNFSGMMQMLRALLNNPRLLIGRDNSEIVLPEFPVTLKGRSEPESSSSSSSSSESSSPPSEPSSQPESDKSTAIVPAKWSHTGYTALFCVESPDVRFTDTMIARVTGRETRVKIDHRFLAACEPETVWAASILPDTAAAVGGEVDGEHVVIRCGWFRRPRAVVITLTGIRKGFLGMRFPTRTHEQFVANEATLNSFYPKS